MTQDQIDETPEYSQGICGDGAAILKDGQPMTIEQIVEELNQAAQARYADKEITVDDIIAWADGVRSDFGTEYASRITDQEAELAARIIGDARYAGGDLGHVATVKYLVDSSYGHDAVVSCPRDNGFIKLPLYEGQRLFSGPATTSEIPLVWISSADARRAMIATTGERAEVAPDKEPGFTVPLYTHPAPEVPDARELPENFSSWDNGFTEGWNACREAMLTASKEQQK